MPITPSPNVKRKSIRNELGRGLSALRGEGEKKGRTRQEVHECIRWLTGYTKAGLAKQIGNFFRSLLNS
ncbi:MAG: DUF2200 family protein [Pyrinomonadaceae bacterium]